MPLPSLQGIFLKSSILKIEFGGNFTVVECTYATNLSFFQIIIIMIHTYITTIPKEV